MRQYRITYLNRIRSEMTITVTAAVDQSEAMELALDTIIRSSAMMVKENGRVWYQYWTASEAARAIRYVDALPCQHAEIEVRVDTDGEEYAVCLDCGEDVPVPEEQLTAIELRADLGAELLSERIIR